MAVPPVGVVPERRGRDFGVEVDVHAMQRAAARQRPSIQHPARNGHAVGRDGNARVLRGSLKKKNKERTRKRKKRVKIGRLPNKKKKKKKKKKSDT